MRIAVVVAVLLVNLFVIALLAGNLTRARARAVLDARVATQNMALLVDHSVSELARRIDQSLLGVADELERMLRDSPALSSRPDVESVLIKRKMWLRDVADFRVTDESGEVRFGPGIGPGDHPTYADRPFFLAHRARDDGLMRVSDPVVGRITGSWSVAFSRRYNHPDGRFAGVIVAGVSVQQFAGLLAGLEVGAHGAAILRAADTGLIAHEPDASKWYAQVGAKRYSTELGAIIASGVATQTFHTMESGDGFERIITYRRLVSPPFHVMVGKGSDDFLAAWQIDVERAVATEIVFLLGTSLLAWLLSRSLRSTEAALAGQRHAYQTLQRADRARRVLADSGRVLVHAGDEAGLTGAMCRTVVSSGGYLMAAVAYVEHDAEQSLRVAARAGADEGYLEQAKLSWGDNERGRGPTGRAVREGTPMVVKGLASDEGFALWREEALRRGYQAMIALPLQDRAAAFGVLSLYAADAEAFDREEVSLLEQLAADLAYGIVSLRGRVAQAHAEAALAQLNAELESRVAARTSELTEANRQLESFSYSVAHDLRAPLRAINGFSALVAMENADRLDPVSREYLERIRGGSERMGRLVDALLNLSRLSRQPVQWQAFDFSAAAAAVAAELREAQPERGVSIEIEPGIIAHGDPGLLTCVLENLLGNAWKFTAQTASAKIEVRAAMAGPEQVFQVHDNGAGFDMQFAARLFEPFQRMHGSERFQGTGVGLATVKNIILRHGGRIWIDSAVEAGTTVSFTLGSPPPLQHQGA